MRVVVIEPFMRRNSKIITMEYKYMLLVIDSYVRITCNI